MADKRFRGRDKIVQKMTKDGLVEENLHTGETKSAVAKEPSCSRWWMTCFFN